MSFLLYYCAVCKYIGYVYIYLSFLTYMILTIFSFYHPELLFVLADKRMMVSPVVAIAFHTIRFAWFKVDLLPFSI